MATRGKKLESCGACSSGVGFTAAMIFLASFLFLFFPG